MPTMRNDEIERMAEYVSEVESERDSYKDEAAEWKIKYLSAEAQIQFMMSDRSVAK